MGEIEILGIVEKIVRRKEVGSVANNRIVSYATGFHVGPS
jgi:hypothetical protein